MVGRSDSTCVAFSIGTLRLMTFSQSMKCLGSLHPNGYQAWWPTSFQTLDMEISNASLSIALTK